MYDDQTPPDTNLDKIMKELYRLESILPGFYPEENIFYKIANLMLLAKDMADSIETIEPFLRHEGYVTVADDLNKLIRQWKRNT